LDTEKVELKKMNLFSDVTAL